MKKVRKKLAKHRLGLSPQGTGFVGSTIDARYTSSSDPILKHNPLVEALNPTLAEEQFFQYLALNPAFHDAMREKPAHERMIATQTVGVVVEPLTWASNLYYAIERVIRYGYMNRNPLRQAKLAQMRSAFPNWDTVQSIIPHELKLNNVINSFALFGTSGVGKTLTLEKVLLTQPQMIRHRQMYEGEPLHLQQLVWLKLECPHTGSLRELITNFFAAVDQICSKNYSATYGSQRRQDLLILAMATVAANHRLGVLVIEEVQRLKNTDDAENLLDFFVQLINTIGVPIVLTGTFQAMPLITESFASARRADGQGDFIWANLDKGDVNWELLSDAIWRYQYTSTKTELTLDLRKTWHELSGGVPDIAVKLYRLVQIAVIGLDDETITVNLFRQVARDHLKLVTPIITALNQKDWDTLAKIPDLVISPKAMDRALDKSLGRLNTGGSADTLKMKEEAARRHGGAGGPVEELIGFLIKRGIGPERAKVCAEAAYAKCQRGTSEIDLFLSALDLASQPFGVTAPPKAPEASDVPKARNTGKTAVATTASAKKMTKKMAAQLKKSEAEALATTWLEKEKLERSTGELFSA